MFSVRWAEGAEKVYNDLKSKAEQNLKSRKAKTKTKSRKHAGLFKQVHKTVELLRKNPKHPSLQTQEYTSIENPYDKKKKVLEAYAQHKNPGAYRVFWCYGPDKEKSPFCNHTAP